MILVVCELCGAKNATLKLNVEGSVMTACHNCKSFGKVISKVEQTKPVRPREIKKVIEAHNQAVEQPVETEEVLVDDYGKIIKTLREQRKMKQEDFAKKLRIKTSMLSNIETQQFEPKFDTVRRIEKMLGIKLIKKRIVEKQKINDFNTENAEPTIGNMIKFKTRKN